MLRSNEIPREEWPAFFRLFSEQHQGRVCSLGIVSAERGAPLNLRALRLSSLERGGDDICVLVSDLSGARLAHVIAAPRHVYVREVNGDVVETLEIEAAGGKTVMRFEAPS